ncbi:unnamed protein product [Fraxinus pennsylvanica]|uniref:Ankyrin repeat protein n=1 Tax=Fraxinus pennsylvanica TaxID=56036 RepID=A0AAD2A2Y6_9LAMI|nr:unnamed protein product [Fraxinus pennsylvanica]
MGRSGFIAGTLLVRRNFVALMMNTTVVKRLAELASTEEIADAIDIPSSVGTALCMGGALRKDHETEGRELVRILLAAGADPTTQDAQHAHAALHTAVMASMENNLMRKMILLRTKRMTLMRMSYISNS